MKRAAAVAIVIALALAMPGSISAKSGTAKIVITGGRLTQPLCPTELETCSNQWRRHSCLRRFGR
jgi:hypothetical protein